MYVYAGTHKNVCIHIPYIHARMHQVSEYICMYMHVHTIMCVHNKCVHMYMYMYVHIQYRYGIQHQMISYGIDRCDIDRYDVDRYRYRYRYRYRRYDDIDRYAL